MNTPTALLLLGGLLSLIAIIGGGFEIRELKIPKVDRLPRTFAGISGILLILAGIAVSEAGKQEFQPSVDSEMITFSIKTQLAENEVSEQSRILIDGRPVGDLTVNEHFPEAMLTVTVPARGRYSYTVSSTLVFNHEGKLAEFAGAGQGLITVEHGKAFELQAAVSGNNVILAIAE